MNTLNHGMIANTTMVDQRPQVVGNPEVMEMNQLSEAHPTIEIPNRYYLRTGMNNAENLNPQYFAMNEQQWKNKWKNKAK